MTAKVNAAGRLSARYVLGRTTTFTAAFAGDTHNAATTASRTVTSAAVVAEVLAGYYGTAHSYRLYHHTSHLDVGVAVAPNKHGECVKFEVEQFYGGAWQPDIVSGCATLNAKSTYAGYLKLSSAGIGYHYRIRADYVPGTDHANLAADSAWQYFIVAN